MKKRILSAVLAVSFIFGGLAVAPNSAFASGGYSSKVYFSGSTYLWSYAYLDTFSWSRCLNFNSWSRVENTTKPVTWIKDTAHFTAWGLTGITVGSSVSGTLSGNDVTLTWTNSNGASGSYISGTVCTGPFTAGVSMQSTGTAFYNGTVRVSGVS